MRLPRGAYAFRLYYGGEVTIYQVVGPSWSPSAVVAVAADETRREFNVPVSWLRGSARELAEALCAEAAK